MADADLDERPWMIRAASDEDANGEVACLKRSKAKAAAQGVAQHCLRVDLRAKLLEVASVKVVYEAERVILV